MNKESQSNTVRLRVNTMVEYPRRKRYKKRYESVIRELDKKIDEFRFISKDEENEEY